MKLVNPIILLLSLLFFSQECKAFQLYCPGDVYVNCNAELWDLSIYGNAYYVEYGNYYDAGTPYVVYDLNTCNTGIIYRTWTVEDPYWNPVSCTQKIYVSGGYFSSQNINWPHQELQLYGCNTSIHPNDLPYGYDRPRYDYLTCSHIGTSFDDKIFNFGPDCKKIIRKWTVIDWCNYVPGGVKGIWTYNQLIKVSNSETPLLSCAKEVTVNALECDSSYVQLEDIFVEGESCTGAYRITNNSPYADHDGANASGKYPIGITKVEYEIEYACGKEIVCKTKIIVKDNKPAVPYCYAGLNVALMPVDSDGDGTIEDGMVEVWAEDLNVGSYHPCGNGPIIFSFSSDVTDRARIFTCEHVGENNVQMWVTDIKGNQAFCVVNLTVQNNAANIPDCEPDEGNKYVLSGKILNENHDPIEQVQLTLKDREPIYQYETAMDSFYNYEIIDSFYNAANALVYIYDLTIQYEERIVDSVAHYNVLYLNSNENGVYGTNDILLNRNYNITAYKAGDMSRVTAEDIKILEAYVNGETEFSSPYSFLAADINEDKSVNEIDLQLLSDLISREEDEWPKERQWIFFNMSEMARMSENPLEDDLSQNVYIENIEDKSHHLNFMGILKGDLSEHEPQSESAAQFRISEKTEIRGQSNDDGSNGNINFYPNPFDADLNLRWANKGHAELKIIRTDGSIIYNKIITGNQINIPEAVNWPEGIYFYSIEADEDVYSGKIIKQ